MIVSDPLAFAMGFKPGSSREQLAPFLWRCTADWARETERRHIFSHLIFLSLLFRRCSSRLHTSHSKGPICANRFDTAPQDLGQNPWQSDALLPLCSRKYSILNRPRARSCGKFFQIMTPRPPHDLLEELRTSLEHFDENDHIGDRAGRRRDQAPTHCWDCRG